MLVKIKKVQIDAILTGDTRQCQCPILSSSMSIAYKLTMVYIIYLKARKSRILNKVVGSTEVLLPVVLVGIMIKLNLLRITIEYTQLI